MSSIYVGTECLLLIQVEVYTGDEQWAGTDANVFFELFGENGKSDKLNMANSSDNFERGAVHALI